MYYLCDLYIQAHTMLKLGKKTNVHNKGGILFALQSICFKISIPLIFSFHNSEMYYHTCSSISNIHSDMLLFNLLPQNISFCQSTS